MMFRQLRVISGLLRMIGRDFSFGGVVKLHSDGSKYHQHREQRDVNDAYENKGRD